MNYKGAYGSGSSYSQGDVVVYTDGVAYVAISAAAAGITPHEERCWARLDQPLQEVVMMFHATIETLKGSVVALEDDLTQTTAGKKALDAHQGKVLKEMIPANISNEAITLSTETADYLITVDDSGESPELVVTAIEEEAGT